MTTIKISLISTSILTAFISSQANANMQSGKDWLSAQNANNTNNSDIANSLQTKQETAQTLQLLQIQLSNNIDINQLLEQESSTEGLVRAILLSHSQNASEPFHQGWEQLKFNQNEDGGFGHIEGWQSNPLDTAFFLIALHETNYLSSLDSNSQTQWQERITKALAYLATQQRNQGSYNIAHLDDLYTSSYVLSAFTPYLSDYGQYIPNTQKLVAYLETKQTAPATWSSQANNKGLFLDALVAEALYPYQSSDKAESFSQAFQKRALAIQNADGSWQQDGYVTALVLRSMSALSKPVSNPITSAISLSVVDAETGLPLPRVKLENVNDSSKYFYSNIDGKFDIKNLKNDSYKFQLIKKGYIKAVFEVNLQKNSNINLNPIKLSRNSSDNKPQIIGNISEYDSNLSVDQAFVTITMVDNKGVVLPNLEPIKVKTDLEGNYQAILPKEGKFKMQIDKNGFKSNETISEIEKNSILYLNFQLSKKVTNSVQNIIYGQVTDKHNNKLDDVSVFIDNNLMAKTKDGFFSFNSQEIGEQSLTFKKDGYKLSNSKVYTQKPEYFNIGTIKLSESNQDGNLEQEFLSEINIELLGSNTGINIDGIPVTVIAEKIENKQVVQTQKFLATNSKLVLNLPVGYWKVSYQHPNYYTKTQSYNINKRDNIKSTKVYLDSKFLTIKGKLIDSINNKPIRNATIEIYSISEYDNRKFLNAVIYTNSEGYFSTNSKHYIRATKLMVNIKHDQYTNLTRIIKPDYETNEKIDLGNLKLRSKLLNKIYPDLVISTSKVNINTSQQSLEFTGNIEAIIENKGLDKISNQSIKVIAFGDSNNNHKIDANENIFGETKLLTNLQIKMIDRNASQKIKIPVNGISNFKNAPITLLVDANNTVLETKESNNYTISNKLTDIKPTKVSLETEEAWFYGKKLVFGNRNNAIESIDITPVLAPVNDSNNDGVIGSGDISSIFYISKDGSIHSINGKTGKSRWIQKQAINTGYYLLPSIAIGDIDNDRHPELVIGKANGEIDFYSADTGNLIKSFKIPNGGKGKHQLAISDVNSDGKPDIVTNSGYLSYIDQHWVNINSSNAIYPPIISNLTDDEGNEIIIGNDVFSKNGNKLFTLNDSYYRTSSAAVADIDNNGTPEIIVTTSGNIKIHNGQNGNLINSIKLTSDFSKSPSPTIGDFDGDGLVDIGVAGSSEYNAFRTDGSLIWSVESEDESSSVTGSSIFDFDNDGRFEVVYADEIELMVLDSLTGQKKISIPHSSMTWIEYPVIADADADGHADIILMSNAYPKEYNGKKHTQYAGIRMISSKNKDWANTRNIWNQYSYHVTNINDDLSVPKNEPNSWEVHNTYRANLLLNQNATAASDLTASYIQVTDKSLLKDSTLSARIGNAGGKSVPAVTPVSFYRIAKGSDKAELLQTVTLTKALIAGSNEASYEDLSIKYKGSLADFGELVVVANDAGAGIDSDTGIPTQDDGTPASDTAVIQEYTRNNNIARLSIDGGTVALTLTGNTDKTIYTANTDVKITAIPTNIGSFPTSPTVKTEIIDSAGNVVAQLAEQKVDLTSALITDPGNSQSLTQSWNTSTKRTGDYTARITLWKSPFASSITGSKPEQVAQVDLPFTIIADADIDPNSLTSSLLFVDKAQYLPTDQVQIHSRIMNTASNAIATQRDITLTVTDPNGNQIWTQNYGHKQLVANAIKDRYFTLPLTKALTGNYTLTQSTTAPDGSQAEQIQTQTFSVLSANDTGYGITGSISSVNEVQVNEQLNWSWQVNNASNTDISNIPLSIALYQGDNTEPFDTLSLSSVNIDKDGKVTGTAPWTAVGNSGDIINAVLVANFNGKQQGLATAQTTLVEPPIDISIGDSTDTSNYQHAPLLVYYSCKEGWKTFYQNSSYGLFDFPCFDERANTLKYYLDSIDVPYKLVKRPEHFADQLQSGLYQQYWLVGALEELRPHTRKELTELANTGDNLLLDSGINSWVNQDLLPLAGGKYGGRLLLSDGTLFKQDNYLDNLAFFPSPQIASTPLTIASREQSGHPFYSSWAIQLQPKNNTSVWANYGGQRKRITQWAQNKEKTQDFPAIISQKYGNGEPVALGFDLINSLDLARKPDQGMTDSHIAHWQSVLKQLLSDRQANDSQLPTDYVPQEVVHIPLNITNPSNSNQQLLIDIDLPIGSQWLGYEGGMTKSNTGKVIDSTNNSIHYQVTLKSGDSLNDLLTIRLPASSGTHAVRVTVSDNHKADDIKLLDQYEARYLVRSIDSRVQLLGDTINSWNILGTNGFFKLNAKMQMTNIRTHRSTGVRQLAVYEASRLATTLAKMQTKDDSPELAQMRYEADELMRALQIDWYIDRDGYVPLP